MCFICVLKKILTKNQRYAWLIHASTVWHSWQYGGKEVMEDAVAQLSKTSTP